MIFFFKSCRLGFSVEYPRRFEQVVRYVLAPFERRLGGSGSMGGVLRLSQMKGEQSKTQVVLEGVPAETKGLLGLVELSKEGISLALRDGAPWEVSAAVGLLLLNAFSMQGGLLLHAAMLLDDHGAHLLLGPSGAGKSTAASLASGMECVHDDKVAVRRIQGRWMAFGSPLLANGGKPGLNREAPLLSLNLVEKSLQTKRIRLRSDAGVASLAGNVTIPPQVDGRNIVQTLMDVALEIPTYRLLFSKQSRVDELLR